MNWFNKIRKYRWTLIGRREIKKIIEDKRKNHKPIKVILGAGHHSRTSGEWINTDLPQFDITNESHWKYLFGNVKIDNLFAEHVFEHLTIEQNEIALKFAQMYLNANGTIRIAIPDKNNQDVSYQNGTKINGSDIGADDHKLFFNIDDYTKLIKKTKFEIKPLEYFDSNNQFQIISYTDNDGYVIRSKKNNFHYSPIPNYTSLIFDLKFIK